jgi:hypothetical protein
VPETLIFAVGDADALRDAVLARYAAGPFTATTLEGPWIRRLEIGDGYVREIGEHLDRGFLASHLATHTAEPVHGQFEGYAFEQLPGETESHQIEVRRPPDHAPAHHLVFALDLAKQRALERAFHASVVSAITKQFPLNNRRKTARLDLKSINAYGGGSSGGPTPFRHDCYLSVELQLALFTWDDAGNDRALSELRKETTVLGRYDLLRPSGAIVRRGEEWMVPYDEYAAEWHTGMTRYLQRIKRLMDRDDWTKVTPVSLLEQD